MTWLLHDWLVVRTTGVPFEVLEELRLPASTAAIDALITVQEAAERHREALLREYFPAAVRALSPDDTAGRRLLSRQRSAIGRRLPTQATDPDRGGPAVPLQQWDELQRQIAAQAERAATAHAAEIAECRTLLHARAADPTVQEAALLLSPDFHATLCRWADAPLSPGANGTGRRDDRRTERRLATYLQRLAAKNETNGRFGPIGYGRLRPESPDPLIVRPAPGRPAVTVFATARLADAVATAIASDPRMRRHLRPRRSVAHQFTGDRAVHTATERAVPLDQRSTALLGLADGDLSCEQLAERLGEPWTRTADRIDTLIRQRLLVRAPLAPPDTAEPLSAVTDRLTALPSDDAVRTWLARVAELRALVADSSVSSHERGALARRELAAKYEGLAGKPASRGAGRMYTDRALVFEEARGTLECFELGASATQALGDGLLPVLDLWRTAALLRRCEDQRQCGQLMDALGTARLPLLSYLRAAVASRPPAREEAVRSRPAMASLDDRMRELLAGRKDEHAVEVPTRDLAALTAEAREEAARLSRGSAELPSFTSVDLLLAAAEQDSAERGEYTLVVGEGHAPPLLSVFPTDHFRRADEADADPVAALLRKVFSDAGVRVAQVVIGRDTKIFPYRLAELLVELRPHLELADRAVPAAQLDVRRSADGCVLHDPDGPLLLHPQLRRGGGFDPLAPLTLPAVEDHPVLLGRHTPRLTVGGVVLQRERWQLEDLPWDAALSGLALLRAAREWQRRNGAPDYVYYRVSEEPKPLLLDFTSQHLVDVFHRHAARTAGPVTLAEMLPGPSDVWLRSREGRHTFELRAFAVHTGGPQDGAGGWRIHRTADGSAPLSAMTRPHTTDRKKHP